MSENNAIPSAVIFGCAGTTLTDEERRFFQTVNPLGFILFARNVETPDQVRALVSALRSTVGRDDAPVLIDQEGGRVQRLRPPAWREAPPGAAFVGRPPEALRLNFRLIGRELAELGINVDCAPVLDVPISGAHDIIGNRAYGQTPAQVIELGRAACDGLLDEGILPIIKHIPGHGRALVDSHLALPVVETSREELETSDFAPFRALRDAPWAMTAHVVYKAIDPRAPATLSPKVIGEIIRGTIGFGGVLVSDDLSMKALGGRFDERATLALEAGCDVVLHCNGMLEEMQAVAKAARPLTGIAQERLARANRMRRTPQAWDVAEVGARVEALLA